MDINGIGYLGFETTKLEEWRTYGPEVMGFQVAKLEADPLSLYFKLDDRRHRFAFHAGKIDRLAYIGWEARGRLEFNAAVDRFRGAGVEVIGGLREKESLRVVGHWGGGRGYLDYVN